MTPQKHLIIIPGIGDDHWAYHESAKRFERLGFKTSVDLIGWNDQKSLYPERTEAIVSHIASLEGEVYLLGISAGGVVALNIFCRIPEKITRVVTLCSPYAHFYFRKDTMLSAALATLTQSLPSLTSRFSDIRSYHGFFDGSVRPALSKHRGIGHRTIPFFIHSLTIFLGLTLYVKEIASFFEESW